MPSRSLCTVSLRRPFACSMESSLTSTASIFDTMLPMECSMRSTRRCSSVSSLLDTPLSSPPPPRWPPLDPPLHDAGPDAPPPRPPPMIWRCCRPRRCRPDCRLLLLDFLLSPLLFLFSPLTGDARRRQNLFTRELCVRLVKGQAESQCL